MNRTSTAGCSTGARVMGMRIRAARTWGRGEALPGRGGFLRAATRRAGGGYWLGAWRLRLGRTGQNGWDETNHNRPPTEPRSSSAWPSWRGIVCRRYGSGPASSYWPPPEHPWGERRVSPAQQNRHRARAARRQGGGWPPVARPPARQAVDATASQHRRTDEGGQNGGPGSICIERARNSAEGFRRPAAQQPQQPQRSETMFWEAWRGASGSRRF